MAATVTSPPTGPPGALLTTTPATASKPAPHWPQPSHPDLITLARGADRFSERAVAASSHPAGAVLASLSAATPAARRTWATVQAGPGGAGDDVDLNSDWVYCNHSCEPSLVFDMRAREVRVVEARPLKEGDDMTFFYPSTEFDMAQPFECTCGSERCVGIVRGARWLNKDVLERYWLNDHIRELLGQGSAVGGKVANGHAADAVESASKTNGHGH